MERRQVTTNVFIRPEDFDASRFYDALLNAVRAKEKTCNSIDGYIDHIFYTIDVVQNMGLMPDGSCHLKVTFDACCFQPHVGKCVDTCVEYVFPQGVLSSLGELKFLIPATDLDGGWRFNNDTQTYINSRESTRIAQGDLVMVEIVNMKYEKEQYSCIAHYIATTRHADTPVQPSECENERV
jgi:DNA-directed RNA polymerase subunit E'/Rpb7